jgi:PAS domain S-box-containing protein
MSRDSILLADPDAVPPKQAEIDRKHFLPLMETVNNGVWLVDTNLHLVAQNKVASKMVGWSSIEAVGRPVRELIPSGNGLLCELPDLLHQVMEKQQSISFGEGILLATKERRPILVGGKMSPVVHEEQTLGVFCAFWDITPEDQNKYLRLEFADMASHLLRTPLSFIQTSIDLMMNSKLGVDEQRTILSRMRNQSQRLKSFANELLKTLRWETEGMQVCVESVALVPLIERVLNLIRYEHPHHQFDIVAKGTLPEVKADATKTELVLLNLLLGAVRRCPDGGYIGIQVERKGLEIIVSVVDNGETIPVKLLDRAFWQFYPVDDMDGKMPSTYQLGLYTTKQFVELQNGRIWAESQVGQGSKFSFSMPVWEEGQ